MSRPVPITSEIAARYGIIWIDPILLLRPDIPNRGLPGVCEWRPGVAVASIGRTKLTIGHVNALPCVGQPQMAIKERHSQDEVFVVFASLQLGLSETMDETAEDVEWVVLQPGVYVIPAGVIHIPPISASAQVAPMVVLQGTRNTTEATAATIIHPAPAV